MATYYIATTGNDSTGDGSSGNPWLTLAKFLASSASGDTCICAAGSYAYATANLAGRTIQGATGGSANSTTGWTVFTGSSAGWSIVTGDPVTINNIWFDSCTSSTAAIMGYTTNQSNTLVVNGCRFTNCIAHGGNSNSIAIGTRNAYEGSGGIYDVTISSCIFDDMDGSSNNASYYFSMRGANAGSVFKFYNNVLIRRNILTVEPTGGIFGAYSSTANVTWTLKNNIFVNRIGSKSLVQTGNTGIMSYNDIVGLFTNTTVLTTSNNITDEPLFIDENNNDFRLRPTSPCIEAGTIL